MMLEGVNWLTDSLGDYGYGRHLGVQFEDVTTDYVRVRLPFREEVSNTNFVHGGAIAGLLDVAATGAAWSAVADPAKARGTTIGFTINYLNGTHRKDLVAEARVIRRGRSIVYIEVAINDGDQDVARGLVTYKLEA
ncbi:MAG: hotdog fold thioesterase [Dehalococcoidia bacterium]|nr:hotdog fold thioesterase [Dehalococcoidia bacterium]